MINHRGITRLAVDGGADNGAADVGDVAATHFDQVPCRQRGRETVVNSDEIRGDIGKSPVEQDARGLLGFDRAEATRVLAHRGQNHGIDAAGQHLLDLFALQGWIVLGRGQDQAVAMRSQGRGETFGDGCEKGMGEVGHDEADQAHAAGDQRPRREVGAVVEFLHSPQNPFARLGTDVRVVVQHLGDGDDGDSQVPGNVLHGGCHSRNYVMAAVFPVKSPRDLRCPQNGRPVLPFALRAALLIGYCNDSDEKRPPAVGSYERATHCRAILCGF